jgi:regulator of protease activity HflC (stomatin/prohibitin superfamily)
VQTTERPARWIHGVVGFVIFLIAAAVILAGFGASRPAKGVLIFCGVVAGVLAWRSMVVVRPNQAAVLTVFGHYGGTLRRAGWSAVNPFAVRVKLSLRIRTLDSDVLKVNDIDGNPIEVSAMVVWQVADTARAVFDVDDYNDQPVPVRRPGRGSVAAVERRRGHHDHARGVAGPAGRRRRDGSRRAAAPARVRSGDRR